MGKLRYQVLVLGLGNPLMSDDGFGVLAAQMLMQKTYSPGVAVMDAGTAAFYFLEEIRSSCHVIAVDTLRAGGKPGTVYRLSDADLINPPGGWRAAHGFTFPDVITLAREIGGYPQGSLVFGVEPCDLSFGNSLSPALKKVLPRIVKQISAEIKRLLPPGSRTVNYVTINKPERRGKMDVKLTTLCENTAGSIGCTGEWGLSILVEARGENVLLDTGYSDSIIRNAVMTGADLKKIDKVVISHGHADHTGGLRPFLQQVKKRVEIFAHPGMWDSKHIMLPDSGKQLYIGTPYREEELEGLGGLFSYSEEPVWLNDFMVTTGKVPMVTPFEKVDGNLYLKTEEGFVPDDVADDQALVVKTEKGLVLILGCSHRGMVNTMMQARKITGVHKIVAVLGGTHLFRAGKEQVEQTVAAIKEFGVEKIGVSHCTGLPTGAMLQRELGDTFFFNNAGTVVEF